MLSMYIKKFGKKRQEIFGFFIQKNITIRSNPQKFREPALNSYDLDFYFAVVLFVLLLLLFLLLFVVLLFVSEVDELF